MSKSIMEAYGSQSPPDISLREVVSLLHCVEERLTQRLDDLPARLEELCKRRPITAVSKKQVKLKSERSIVSADPTPSEKDLDVVPGVSDIFDTVENGLASRRQSDSSPTVTEEPPKADGDAVFSVASASRRLWKKIGTRPSEAAKAFVRDALTKSQKKKIMKSMQFNMSTPDTEDGPECLPGIAAVLDLKGDQHNGTFTDTMHGWWNPESEDAEWLAAAKRRASHLKSSVYDLLVTKGWVAPQPHLSSRIEHLSRLSRAERLVSSTKFEMWCSLMILLNAALLGWQTQYRALPENDGASLPWLQVMQTVFTIWFALEVIVRLYAWRLNFFLNKDCKWNIFDLTVVTISVIELILQASNNEEMNSNWAVVRMIRILRLVRAVRFIRVVRFFTELRMMIYSSLKSVKPFCWALGILLIIIYVFAIVTTQIVTDYRIENPDKDLTKMLKFFGSLHQSIYTLFMVISSGISWMEPADELISVHWSFAIWMSLYVAFVMFAVLNIVTGIFIESALKSAQDDQDVVIQEEMVHEDSLAQGFLEVFQRCDDDKSGYIDAEEFDLHLSDHRVRAFLHHLGLDIPEAHGLFRLLDIGGTGRVYAKEFVLGCQQLKGPAKNVDVATLLFQNKRMMTLWAAFMSYVEDQFALLLDGHDDHACSSPPESVKRRSTSSASPRAFTCL
mmetsp:Transcript_118147/g.214876  ORF Transcript_118147/g.214876 Transcript_118147/m.214876 type:complete len:675 (-) Transcript_118147:38-2062(-)